MNAPFELYLRHLCFHAQPDGGVGNWAELRRHLDDDGTPPLQPPPRRRPIATPQLDLSLKGNLRSKPFARGEQRGWQRVVEYRQRVSLALTIATTGAILYLSAIMLRAQQMPEAAFWLYLLVYRSEEHTSELQSRPH